MLASVLLREARQSAGLTQAQLAERLAVSQPVIARLEASGSNPTWNTFARALRATGYTVSLERQPTSAAPLDLSQLRRRLALSPADRLQLFQASHRELTRLRSRTTRSRG
jgi:transcriptional regulator with XRE-family HTH domain